MNKIHFSFSWFLAAFLLFAAPAYSQISTTETNEEETNTDESGETNSDDENDNDSVLDDVFGGGGMKESLVRDGAYDKIGVKEKVALSYDDIREADVFWSKRVWQVIDTRQKMNHTFSYVKQPFIRVLFDVIDKNSDVRLFLDDSFTEEITKGDVAGKLGTSEKIEVYDVETEEYITKNISNEFNPEEVTMFRVKEDWIFDEEASMMVCRIIGIAPIRDVIDETTGMLRGQEAMFWLYYPDIRKYLCRYEAYNPYNDAIKQTWDKVLDERRFDSYVVKENNVRDERITDYYDGRNALLESERIKKNIFEKEHDLWSY